MNDAAAILASAFAGGLVGGGAIIGLLWNAAENRLRKTFATRDDVNGIGRKVGEQQRELSSMDDRFDAMRDRLTLVEERQTQQWERISEQMAHTAESTREATRELREVARTVQDLALRMERMQRENRA